MNDLLLSAEQVEALHDLVLNDCELSGRARDKSLEGALARVDNRLVYGMIDDVFDLAAAYAEAIATDHRFNDANKRTAYQTMLVCLAMNDVRITHDFEDIGARIIALAQRILPAEDLADWLRAQTA